MKNYTYKLLTILFFMSIGNVVFAQLQHDVSFYVDLSNADPFDPETDDIWITGSFIGWIQPGTDINYKMEPTEPGSFEYTITIPIETGLIEYKYFRIISGVASWDHGEWSGDPNREGIIESETSIYDVWGDILAQVDSENALNFNVYPNPTHNFIHIKNLAGENKIEIFDLRGKVLKSVELFEANNLIMDVSDLKKGLYMVRITHTKGISTMKFIKD